MGAGGSLPAFHGQPRLERTERTGRLLVWAALPSPEENRSWATRAPPPQLSRAASVDRSGLRDPPRPFNVRAFPPSLRLLFSGNPALLGAELHLLPFPIGYVGPFFKNPWAPPLATAFSPAPGLAAAGPMMSALYKCSNFQIRIFCSEEERGGGGGGGVFSQRLQLQVNFAGGGPEGPLSAGGSPSFSPP